MNKYIYEETENKVYEFKIIKSELSLLKELEELGFDIPDVKVQIIFESKDEYECVGLAYVGFEYHEAKHLYDHLYADDCVDDGYETLKEKVLNRMRFCRRMQYELLFDLEDNCNLIVEADAILERDYRKYNKTAIKKQSCNLLDFDEDEEIPYEAGKTFVNSFNINTIPLFAYLKAYDFDFPDLTFKVEFTTETRNNRTKKYLKYYFKFEGYEDFPYYCSLHIRKREKVTPRLILKLFYRTVINIPAFYFNLIHTLPESNEMIDCIKEAKNIIDCARY